jgi:thioredoxin 1
MSAMEVVRAAATATRMARPRLVFFYSRSSGACRRADGFLAQVLQRRGNHDTFAIERVEESERPDLHERFGIDLLPTLVVIEGKHVCGKLVGPAGCAPIERFLARWLR